jgi:hypothetical protein
MHLVRGEDFYVHRLASFRRRLYFTHCGLARLRTRSYHLTREPRKASSPQFGLTVPPSYNGTSRQETLDRIRDTINLVIREYGNHPCAVPNCLCMVHRLGLL